MTIDDAKRAVGAAAAALVEPGMRLGLGTGSTVEHFLVALAQRRLDIAGVPTSEATAQRCRELGIALTQPSDVERLDLAVDGADEIDGSLDLVKGGGGALLREKVVANMANAFFVIATQDKRVGRLADRFPLPVEVVPFALAPVCRTMRDLGFEVTPRGDGAYRTDNGNAIVDARWHGGLDDPDATDAALARIPGVVETGLFVGLTTRALLAAPDGTIETLTR